MLALAFAVGLLPVQRVASNRSPLEERFSEVLSWMEAGELDRARAGGLAILADAARHVGAATVVSDLAERARDPDEALLYARRALAVFEGLAEPSAGEAKWAGRARDRARRLDPNPGEFDALRAEHAGALARLGERHLREGRPRLARRLFEDALRARPRDPAADSGLGVALASLSEVSALPWWPGGVGDPLAAVSAEWTARNDPVHSSWKNPWEFSTKSFRIRTDAGFETAVAIGSALEQALRAWRAFRPDRGGERETEEAPFEVRLYRNLADWRALARPPRGASAAFHDGGAVAACLEGTGLPALHRPLFHEIAHAFARRSGGGNLPPWLDEGIACLFEGFRLREDGLVEWTNLPEERVRFAAESVRAGALPLERALRGREAEAMGPEGTAQAWALVRFLHDERDESGRARYLDALLAWIDDPPPRERDPVEAFVEAFVRGIEAPGIASLADFEEALQASVLRLEREAAGDPRIAAELLERGDAAFGRGSFEAAARHFEEARKKRPGDAAILARAARAHERLGRADEAAALAYEAASAATADEATRLASRTLAETLDPLARETAAARARFEEAAIALAEAYRSAGFPRVAHDLAERLASSPLASPDARLLEKGLASEARSRRERWRRAFDGESFEWWYNSQPHVRDFAAAGEEIRGAFRTNRTAEPVQPIRILLYRREFEGPYAFEAECRRVHGAEVVGLVFAATDLYHFRGTPLHRDGFLDLATWAGTSWRIHRRLKVGGPTEGWRRMRVEVAGAAVAVFLDGTERLRFAFPADADTDGDFGVLLSEGEAAFRDLRFRGLDPAERISVPRREAEAGRAEGGLLFYEGLRPPEIDAEAWGNDEPSFASDLLGRPAILAFLSARSEAEHPCLPAIEEAFRRHGKVGLRAVVVAARGDAEVGSILARSAVPAPVALDAGATFAAYRIEDHGLPRAYLLDLDGRVVWEGNPQWDPRVGSLLDEPLDALVARRGLGALKEGRERIAEGEAAIARGEAKAALEAVAGIASLEMEHPLVARARALRASLESDGRALLSLAERRRRGGRIGAALALLRRVAEDYAGTEAGEAARRDADALEASHARRARVPEEKTLERVLDALEKNETDRAERMLRDLAARSPDAAEHAWAEKALAAGEPAKAVRERLVARREARSLLDAAEEASALGRRDQAARLAAEALSLAPDAPFAEEARALAGERDG